MGSNAMYADHGASPLDPGFHTGIQSLKARLSSFSLQWELSVINYRTSFSADQVGAMTVPTQSRGNLWQTISNPFKATQLQVVELLQTPAIWLLNDGSWVHQHLSESLTSWRYSTDELMEWVCEKPKGSNHLLGHIKQAVLGRSVVSHSLRPHGL